MAATANDFLPLRTADGSLTLRSAQLGEQYHSVHGAVQESTHVFIKAGLEHIGRTDLDILEVGLGTGLNMLLTWVRCMEGKCSVRYTALEPYPLSSEALVALDHCAELAWPGLHDPFMERMSGVDGEWYPNMGGFTFRRSLSSIDTLIDVASYDLIYYDAFGPNTQPEMWTVEVFERLFQALRPGGVLVTYCAKGEVRRTMIAAGFTAERLPGPPGKREMLRASKA